MSIITPTNTMTPTAPLSTADPNASILSQIGTWASSPQGQSALQSMMQGISSYAQNTQNQQNLQNAMSQNLGIAQGQLGTNAAQSIMQDALTRSQNLATQAPTGWAQQYEQQQEIRNLALQKLLNPTASGLSQSLQDRLGIQAPFVPTLPADWAQANPFSVNDTMQALSQRQGVLDNLSGGQAPAIDFTQLGIDPTLAGQLNQQGQQYRNYAGGNYDNMVSNLQNAANLSRNPAAGGGSGTPQVGMSKGMSALAGAGTGATYGSMVMPGIGTAVGAGVGALIGAIKGGKTNDPNAAGSATPIPWASNLLNPYATGSAGNANPAPSRVIGAPSTLNQNSSINPNFSGVPGGYNNNLLTGTNGLPATPDINSILARLRSQPQQPMYRPTTTSSLYGGG